MRTLPRYSAMTYSVVSDEPIRAAAMRAACASTPRRAMRSCNAESDPDPDTGRITKKGRSSTGSPSARSAGESRRYASSSAPLPRRKASSSNAAHR